MDTIEAAPFTEADIGRVVGHLTVGEDHKPLEETFETAAWYRMHKPTPGVYPITLERYAHGGFSLNARDVPCTVTAAYLGTLWGGVAIGADTTGPREIGKATTRTIPCGFKYKLDEVRLPAGATPA